MRLSATQPRRREGYSLVELLLTVSLLMLFAGLAVISMDTLNQGSTFNEGATRFETMVRFAHAEAARIGHRVRIDFIQETNAVDNLGTNPLSQVHLSWEPNPTTEPDIFQDLSASRWGIDQVNDALRVADVHLMDDGADQADAPDDSQTGVDGQASLTSTNADFDNMMGVAPVAPSAITFNPDGSCDAAEITLVGLHPEEDHTVILRVDGATGVVTRRTPPAKVDDSGAPAGETNSPPALPDNPPSR